MAIPIVMPRLGDFMTEGVVTKFTKSKGDVVAQGEVIAEIETEKVNYDLEAVGEGIFHPVVNDGATVSVDGVMGYLLAEGELPPPLPAVEGTRSGEVARSKGSNIRQQATRTPATAVPSTPGARRLAVKLGVQITEVTPTGPRGRVVEADVRAFSEMRPDPSERDVPPGLPEPSTIVQLSGMRKSIADHMRSSLAKSAQLSYFMEVDVTEAQRLRREATGLTLADLLIKSCVEALERVPSLNAVLVEDRILYFDQINVAFAVALTDGLIVPVLRNAGAKTLRHIGEETRDLANRAKDGKISPDEVLGGTFTISVLGSVDGFTPILNQSQVAILGAGRTLQKPVVSDGQIVVREMMTLSLTADHQVIDGSVAGSFMRSLQQRIERPASLFK